MGSRILLCAAALIGGAACATQATPQRLDRLLDRAVTDLQCQPAEVELVKLSLDGSLQQADGCGRSRTYAWEHDDWIARDDEHPRAAGLRSWVEDRRDRELCAQQRASGQIPQRVPLDCPFERAPVDEDGTATP